ncbi:MAG: hypothetical protein IJZ74_09215 [Clostridia bacterium]|nr:hypothetical protein [Clostridia bacterium]
MDARAIVYVSNTGHTAAYASLLADRLALPSLTLDAACRELPPGTPVIYMGWLMAGTVKDYRKAAKRFAIRAVCGVGLGDTGSQDAAARKACGLPEDFPVFTLQGGMDLTKLHGPYRLAIRLLTKGMAAKQNRTSDEDKMLALLIKGGDYVSGEHLSSILAWAAG